MGANTAAYVYLDTASFGGKCEKDFEKINKACKPEEEKSDKNKHPVLKKMLGAKRVEKLESMAKAMKDKHGFQGTKDNAWMSHCDGLWMKPDATSAAEFNQMLKDMSDDIGKAIEEQIKPYVAEATKEAIKDKMIGKGGKAVGKKVAAKFIPGVGWVMTGYDAVQAGIAVKDIRSAIEVAQTAQNELKDLAGNIQNLNP